MNLRTVRIEADIPQYKVAQKLNVSNTSYNLWENENTTIPLKRLIDFCNYFDISLDYALGLTTTRKYSNMKQVIDYKLHRRRLKLIRRENNYTQSEIAKLLNTDNGVISRYENGITLILTSFLIEYSKIFNISTDYLMGRIDEKILLNKKIPS